MAAPATTPAAPAVKAKKVHQEPVLERFCVPALGVQHQSKRSTAPVYSISKCTRKMREKVFISKAASESQLAPDVPGAIYDVKSTINLDSGQKFGTGPQRTFGRWKNKYEYEKHTIDRLGEITERHNRHRYQKQADVAFTKTPIGLTNNIEIMKAHPIAFQGTDSPGPKDFPSIEKTSRYKSFPKMPFGIKTDIGSMYAKNKNNTFPNIGPNSYPPLVSFGPQHISKNRNSTTHAFPKGPKFGKGGSNNDAGGNINMNLSSFGKQVQGGRDTEPLVGFSRGTRAQAGRMQRCMTSKDSAAPKGKIRIPHPPLPVETQMIAYSGSMGAFS